MKDVSEAIVGNERDVILLAVMGEFRLCENERCFVRGTEVAAAVPYIEVVTPPNQSGTLAYTRAGFAL